MAFNHPEPGERKVPVGNKSRLMYVGDEIMDVEKSCLTAQAGHADMYIRH